MALPDYKYDLEQAFSPSAPIASQDLFAGRIGELNRAVEAINQSGQHFVVYGDRGVGKTSFANILCTKLNNLVPVKVTCSRADSFLDLWKKALCQLRFTVDRPGMGFIPEKINASQQFDLFLPSAGELSGSELLNVLSRINSNLLFLFDEYDSITESRVREAFADFIKYLSDNSARVTIGLVGIAEDVPRLIGNHQSIERCLKQIKMPAMTPCELSEIIDRGSTKLGIEFSPDVKRKIVYFSAGYPHFTHLLGKYAARSALARASGLVASEDYEQALDGALSDTSQSVQNAYHLATLDAKKIKSRFLDVLHACSVCNEDEFGTFSGSDVVAQLNREKRQHLKAQNINYNLQKLCEIDRGAVLAKVGGGTNLRYRFQNPLLRAYVRMKLEKVGQTQRSLLV